MALRCSNNHDNANGAFFCTTCGEPLESAQNGQARICQQCGAPNTLEADVCAECAQPLPANRPPAHVAAARLVVIADGTVYPIDDQNEVVVGRSDPTSQSFPDVDLTPHNAEAEGVSRVHLRIRAMNGRYVVEDQQSVNKTFLNRQRLDPFVPRALKHGDELRLGHLYLRFELRGM